VVSVFIEFVLELRLNPQTIICSRRRQTGGKILNIGRVRYADGDSKLTFQHLEFEFPQFAAFLPLIECSEHFQTSELIFCTRTNFVAAFR